VKLDQLFDSVKFIVVVGSIMESELHLSEGHKVKLKAMGEAPRPTVGAASSWEMKYEVELVLGSRYCSQSGDSGPNPKTP